MAKNNTDAHRIKLFCYYMSRLCNGGEAAVKAGYPAKMAEEVAAGLLTRASIRRRIADMRQEMKGAALRELAVQGLLRLAFGSVNEAAELMCGEEPSPWGLDLFHISELRRPKGGGWELRFYNRLDAMKLLLEYAGRGDGGERQSSFYEALEQAAKAVNVGENAV